MPVCPAGHDSTATDFCDVCGMKIGGTAAPAASAGSTPGSAAPTAAQPLPGPAEPCPQCGTERSGQFCEVCGYDFAAGRPALAMTPAAAVGVEPAGLEPAGLEPAGAEPAGAEPAGAEPAGEVPVAAEQSAGADPNVAVTGAAGAAWTAVVSADRQYFDSVIAAGGPDAASIQFPAYCPERRFQLTGKEVRIGRRSASRGLEPEIDLSGPPTDPGISHLHAVLIAQPDGTWSVLDPGSSNGTQVNGAELETSTPVPLHPGDRVCLGAWTVLTIHAG
jgi:hypothetical protein